MRQVIYCYAVISYAAYLQDVSRLLDLCRQTILFDSLAGVADCLTAIADDSSVKIVQVTRIQLVLHCTMMVLLMSLVGETRRKTRNSEHVLVHLCERQETYVAQETNSHNCVGALC